MNTVELFCGTKSFSTIARELGHETLTVDNDPVFNPDICEDIRLLRLPDKPIDILWASPPCQGFSVAAMGKNWNRDYTPKSDRAREAMELARTARTIVEELKPKWWFIENPRGMLRKLAIMEGVRRVTVSYCQYGDSRMKPTDIWTNVPAEAWTPRPMCKNGDTCHEAAPRGSKTGTQGLKGAAERGRIPPALFHEIFSAIARYENP